MPDGIGWALQSGYCLCIPENQDLRSRMFWKDIADIPYGRIHSSTSEKE